MSRLRLWLLDILMGKEKDGMAIVYATLIIKGKKTLEQVPAILREQVEQILEDLEIKLYPGPPGPSPNRGRPHTFQTVKEKQT